MPRPTLTLVASIGGRDVGAKRLKASNALCPSILATPASLFRAADNYLYVRDWPRAIVGFNRVLKIAAGFLDRQNRPCLPRSGSNRLSRCRPQNFANHSCRRDRDGDINSARWDLAMLERDYATAEKILTDLPLKDFPSTIDSPKKHFTRVVPPSPAATSNWPNAILPRRGRIPKIGYATIPTLESFMPNSDYSTPTCKGRRMPSEKVVEPSKSSQKARTHFMALFGQAISRWFMHSLASRTRRSR